MRIERAKLKDEQLHVAVHDAVVVRLDVRDLPL
jgi:hypothetical protein